MLCNSLEGDMIYKSLSYKRIRLILYTEYRYEVMNNVQDYH